MPTKILRTTSFTRPLSPAIGEMYFETDTKNFIIYDGTGWRVYEDDGTTANILSLDFNRANSDRLDTTYTSSATAFSFSFWMKSTDISSYSQIMVTANNGNFNLARSPATDSSGNRYWYPGYRTSSGSNYNDANYGQGGNIVYTTAPNFNPAYTAGSANSFCDGDWHHVVVTLANEVVSGTTTTRYIMYKNGSVFVNQRCIQDNGWKNNDPFAGGDGTSTHSFGDRATLSSLGYTGKMDQMAFFESALSSTDVSNIYNSGNGGDLLALGFSPDAYYRVGYFSEDTNSDNSVASAGNNIGTVADYSGNNDDASQSTVSKKPNYVADTPWS